jgi:hypothetical protein
MLDGPESPDGRGQSGVILVVKSSIDIITPVDPRLGHTDDRSSIYYFFHVALFSPLSQITNR